MRGTAAALCIAVAAFFGATLPAPAQAAPCADHMFTALQKSRAPNNIPKTKSVRRGSKARTRVAARARTLHPKRAPLAQGPLRKPVALVRLEAPIDEPSFLEELDIEWFAFAWVLDDPRRHKLFGLRPSRVSALRQQAPRAPFEAPREGVRSRVFALRTRLLPKIPEASAAPRLVG